MLESNTILRSKGPAKASALANADAAMQFWSALPHDDPLQTQRRICDEIAKSAGLAVLDVDRYRALRVLDRRASGVLEGIVSAFAALTGQSSAMERHLWQAALELCRSFSQELEAYLRLMRDDAKHRAWQERAPELLVRLFFHREIELLLALFHYEKWPRGKMKSMHDAYRYALDTHCATRAVPIEKRADGSIATMTPQHAYIRVLLLQLLDTGQFRPDQLVRARRAIAKCYGSLGLREIAKGEPPQHGFVVDLASDAGLVRKGAVASGDLHWLDTTPIATAIDAKRVDLAGRRTVSAPRSTNEQNLLGKLCALYAPHQRMVKRRGERTPVALVTVDAAVGSLQTIFRMLRDEARRAIAISDVATPYADEITIMDVGSHTRSSARREASRTRDGQANARSTWHVRDRSESGCRLRGRASDSRTVAPGLLIAYREDKQAFQTMGVVRRLSRLMGSNLEIGVEIIGRNPQRIVLLAGASGADSADVGDAHPERFVALFLPECNLIGMKPARTLLVPACEYAAGRVMTMLSTTKESVIRLGEALDQQPDFVWTNYETI